MKLYQTQKKELNMIIQILLEEVKVLILMEEIKVILLVDYLMIYLIIVVKDNNLHNNNK